MTTNNNGQEKEKITALYCRLSVDDLKEDKNGKKLDESNSITNQELICKG